jgi:uncharacterized membrane protein YccC
MWPNFVKACLFSLAGYAIVILLGFWFALAVVPVLQTMWAAFCVIRLIQTLRRGGHKVGAPESDRENFGFALGGLLSSLGLFGALAILPIKVV